jgi:hypothetical protein
MQPPGYAEQVRPTRSWQQRFAASLNGRLCFAENDLQAPNSQGRRGLNPLLMLLRFVKDALRAQQQCVTVLDCIRHFAVKVSQCLDWLSSHAEP